MQYLTKSKAAFRLSVQTFFRRVQEGKHQAFLWTFTLKEVMSVKDAFLAWSGFAKALAEYGRDPETGEDTIFGLRVAELHPGGHGVHFHVLVNRRINIHQVRRRAEKFGFFWIDVTEAYDREDSMGYYLSKYLSKEDRPPCFKGRRLWQSFGKWGHTKCSNVEVRSEFNAAYRARRKMLAAEFAVAQIQGRKYRVENSLETMFHARLHCDAVLRDEKKPLCPDLWFVEASQVDGPPPADWVDVETAWEEALGVIPVHYGPNVFVSADRDSGQAKRGGCSPLASRQ